jgi:DNA processing protein
MSACERCLRRSYLIAHLAPRIAGLLDKPRGRPSGVLDLDEDVLIARLTAGERTHAAHEFLAGFDAEQALLGLVEADIAAVCRHSADYPESLRQLADPPRVLYSTASDERLAKLTRAPAATVVGTRRPSPYGVEMAQALGRGLAAAGVTVISGLALGVDALAHKGALERRGRAIAVLACGADLAYPARHRDLYGRVREAGVVLSELPPGCRPFRWSFPARNRIMAALGAITVVVEAADPSGSLITASFAADLGRTVGAVPGQVTSRVAAGSNRLLRDGAATIRNTVDILDEMFGIGNGPSGPREAPADPADAELEAAPRLEPRLRAVLDGVEAGEGVGEIAARTGMSAPAVRSALGELELEGLIVAGGVGWYQRAAWE